jgi:poly-gamma-glutamate synthesis protein (capsule biosynthesis protein)
LEFPESSLILAFVGDIMLARKPGDAIHRGIDPFVGVVDIFSGADIIIGNLECVIATGGVPQNLNFNFRAEPQALQYLANAIDVVAIANNHAGDYGKEAFLEHLEYLDTHDIRYCGGGTNSVFASAPACLAIGGHKLAFLAFNDIPPCEYSAALDVPGIAWLSKESIINGITKAKHDLGVDIVCVYLHWGEEYVASPSEAQQRFAREIIEAGADIIIGSHSHIVQKVEKIGRGIVAYSLGNFIFDDFLDVEEHLQSATRTGAVLLVSVGEDHVLRWRIVTVEIDQDGLPRTKA